MLAAYIVVQKSEENRHFSLKMVRIVIKDPVFAKNRANLEVLDVFVRKIVLDSENLQKVPDFSKSLPKRFEIYWIRGRVKSIAYGAIKQKTAYHVDGARS
jgi:hypothetical protein